MCWLEGRAPKALCFFLLLLLAGRALGNEGAAAGSCSCEKHEVEPPMASRYHTRLWFWEECLLLIRFTFPQKKICGPRDAVWVIQLMNLYSGRRKGAGKPEARGAHPKTTPAFPLTSTSQASLVVQTQTTAPQSIPQETLGTQRTPELTVAVAQALASTGSPSQPGNEAEPSRAPRKAENGSSKTAVISLLVVALISVAVATAVVCRRRRRPRGGPCESPGEAADETLCLRHHREET